MFSPCSPPCPQVESTFWLARRNGKPFITGNTFPDAIAIPLVEAMCPRRVCRTCGTPSRRLTDVRHVGWSTCGCPDTEQTRDDGFHDGDGWRPGLVLDPYCGTGTTLLVSTGHGRDAIGIDLDARNAVLAEERCGMFLTIKESAA